MGHWPVLFAEVASGFAAVGCRVAVLTSRGWCLEGETDVPFSVYRYGWLATKLDGLALRLRQNQLSGRWRDWLRRAGYVLRVVVIARAAATRAHAMGRDTVVVVLSDVDAPDLIAAFAGRGRWLSYVWSSPRRPATAVSAYVRRAVRRLAATSERSRRARGGRSVVGTETASLRDEWTEARPDMDVKVMLLTGGGDAPSIPDAREKLGIDPSLRLALLIGARYDAKDRGTVLDAFSDLDDWHLVVAGGMADSLPRSARVFRRYPGFVDDQTYDLLYGAADIVVISFHPGFIRNSGTLRDAITWGVPVVCSDGSAPADVVRDYRLGTLFEAGDPDSLARAVRAAPAAIHPADLARARTERSSRVVAEQALHALGAIG